MSSLKKETANSHENGGTRISRAYHEYENCLNGMSIREP